MGSLANTWASAYDRKAGLHEVTQMERAAAFQLLSLRKKCVYEGLGDVLELVMSNIGVSEHDVEKWESLTIQGSTSQQQLQLGGLRDPNPGEQRKDRLTRTNEWMLGVFYAFPHFIELHRKIMDLEGITRRKSFQWEEHPDIHQWEEHRGSAYETARRTIVKFWFLDSAAMSEEEYAASHVVGSDSDATFRKLDEEIESSDNIISEACEAEPNAEMISEALEVELNTIMSKETAPMLNLPSGPTQGVDLAGMGPILSQEQTLHDLPPDRISRKAVAAAQKAVADYRACYH